MEVLFTPINRKTWVEELHAWLQFNPLAVDIVLVAARQVPIITAAKDFQDGKYNFMDCELVLSVQPGVDYMLGTLPERARQVPAPTPHALEV